MSGMLHTTVTEENVLFNFSILSRAVSGLSGALGGPERLVLRIVQLLHQICVYDCRRTCIEDHIIISEGIENSAMKRKRNTFLVSYTWPP